MVDIIMTLLVVNISIVLVSYLYTSLAISSIAKKTGTKRRWMAWIPFVNILLLANVVNMRWWPIFIFPVIYGMRFIPFEHIGITIVLIVLSITLLVYLLTIWEKVFKRVGMSGWWVLALLVPILNVVAIGIAAWSKRPVVSLGQQAQQVAQPQQEVAQ